MFWATGDTHTEWSRFSFQNFPEGRELGRDDIVFVMGDFGIWDDSKRERHDLDWLAEKTFTICFVSGNHENYDMLDGMPKEMWNGGWVNRIRPNVIHLRRGQVFEIQGKRFFTFGGARCHDIDGGVLDPADADFKKRKQELDRRRIFYRVKHESWWEQELPVESEMEEGRRNLERCGWKVDYILTHCASDSVQAKVDSSFKQDVLTRYLEEIRQKTEYRYWLFGHYHDNRKVTDRDILLYEQIVRIPG